MFSFERKNNIESPENSENNVKNKESAFLKKMHSSTAKTIGGLLLVITSFTAQEAIAQQHRNTPEVKKDFQEFFYEGQHKLKIKIAKILGGELNQHGSKEQLPEGIFFNETTGSFELLSATPGIKDMQIGKAYDIEIKRSLIDFSQQFSDGKFIDSVEVTPGVPLAEDDKNSYTSFIMHFSDGATKVVLVNNGELTKVVGKPYEETKGVVIPPNFEQ